MGFPAPEQTAWLTYQLHIRVPAPLRLTIGKLGTFDLVAGDYVYTGSAQRNFEARIARHLRATKALHWHIDYLLAAPGVRITHVIRSQQPECRLNQAAGGSVPIPGFGASDCRNGCGAHLILLRNTRDGFPPALPTPPC